VVLEVEALQLFLAESGDTVAAAVELAVTAETEILCQGQVTVRAVLEVREYSAP
jgi:hypothetical protein